MKENFPDLAKEIDMQVQEAQSIPNKLDPKRTTPRYIKIKMPKVKDKQRILKAAREKQTVTYKGVFIRLSADFSKETLQARKGRNQNRNKIINTQIIWRVISWEEEEEKWGKRCRD